MIIQPKPRRASLTAASFIALCACRAGDMSRCETMTDDVQRQACRADVMARITDDADGIQGALEVCGDPATRDLLRLELLADDPERSLELCPDMEGEQARDWCRRLQGRTHLWRTGDAPGQRAPAQPEPGDAAVFERLDQVGALVLAGDLPTAVERCDEEGASAWRRECHYRVAELLAHGGRMPEAYRACEASGGALLQCLNHVGWIGSEGLVDAGPSDAGAQAAVDAFAGTLPALPDELHGKERKVESNARAAAWHGVYAGSGSADPAAARAADPGDAPLARGAFAWELVRLLGPQLGVQTLAHTAWWTWQGETPPPAGAPLAQPCWPARVLPRSNEVVSARVTTARHFPNGKRVVAKGAQADLTIAVLEAVWSQGGRVERAELEALLDNPDPAVRRAAAKYVGLSVELFPDPLAALDPDDGYASKIALSTREASLADEIPRFIDYPSSRACPR